MNLLLRILLIVTSVAGLPASAAQYDVVIHGGRVMDPETGLDAVRNVGIRGDRIVTITTAPLNGAETIDATGYVVSAGFVDLEQHGLDPWSIKVNLRDGVTTQMDLELGALNIAEWYAAKEGKTQANFGTTAGQEYARMRVHDDMPLEGPEVSMPFSLMRHRSKSIEDGVDGWSVTRSTVDQIDEIHLILDEELRQGALGIGSTIGYAAKGINTYEMYTSQKLAAAYGRLTSVHHRFHPSRTPPTEAQIGAKELIANAMTLNAPLQIHHDNDHGWWENQELMADARAQGYNIWATYYPWIAGAGNYGAAIVQPGIWQDLMGYRYEETIFDPQLDRFMNKEEFLEMARREPGRTLIAYSPPRKKWLPEWTKIEHFIIASDGMPGLNQEGQFLDWDSAYEDYAGHPRTAGSHAALLRIARENNVPLMHSLSQLSYWPAKHLGDTGLNAMQERGRMQEGMVADIVVFDAEDVRENATFKARNQGLPSSGIPHVLVSGQVVVRDAVVQKNFPGRAIRFPVEETGRYSSLQKDTDRLKRLTETFIEQN